MHLPDGFLTPAVWAPLAGASALVVGAASARSRKPRVADRSTSTAAAAMAALVFSAQAVQFPIPGGSSGHLLGGALLAGTIGPARALVAMAAVFTTQAAAFHDGGVLVLGANLFNGAVVPVFLGWASMALGVAIFGERARRASLAAGAFLGVLTGATLAAIEVGLSGTFPFTPFLAAMLGTHLWIALAESVLTVGLMRLLGPAESWDRAVARPDGARPDGARRRALLAAIGVTALAAIPFSSSAPDGLESAALALGAAPEAPAAAASAPLVVFAFAAGALACGSLAWAALAAIRSKAR